MAAFASDDFGDFDDDDLITAAAALESHSTASAPAKRKFGEVTDTNRADYSNASKKIKASFSPSLAVVSQLPPTAAQASNDDPGSSFPEIEDIPSDFFDAANVSQTSNPRLGSFPGSSGKSGPLRQATLFGTVARTSGPQSALPTGNRAVYRKDKPLEPPTHHRLDLEAAKTWIYPTNIGTIRDYQLNITHKGLYNNLLVALPTGLGKTFIAATIILNWYRWAPDSKLIFMAPTRPLVAQQMEACCMIAGIRRSDTVIMTGTMKPAERAIEWETRRVFFCTPQVVQNDVSHGMCDPKKIVCLVVDEAHRATGNYSYVEVTKNIRRFNKSFRVLALTATPGSTIESVQAVINGLGINEISIRTEQSIDIQQYVHARREQLVVVDLGSEIDEIKDLYCSCLQPLLEELNKVNKTWVNEAERLTAFGLTTARQKWMASPAGQGAGWPMKNKVNTLFTILSQLAHPLALLTEHGIVPFHNAISSFITESLESKSKYKREVLNAPNFKIMQDLCERYLQDPEFLGHPKMERLVGFILRHFAEAEDGGESAANTRIMVFAQYRDSAEHIVKVLERHKPMIKPQIFVGQAATKRGGEGMAQKQQIKVIENFQKGLFNVLVATSIGEEGLDIGEVDLIVCYDSSSSPIRMLQRMGRTGRKRAGNIILLLTPKEERNFARAKDNYEKMQLLIASGASFEFRDEVSPRILPRDIQPEIDKRVVDIPIENSQADPESSKKKKGRQNPLKKPPKKFFLPDGAITSFTKASRVNQDGDVDAEEHINHLSEDEGGVAEPAPLAQVLLSDVDQQDLSRRYLQIADGDINRVVRAPRLDAFPNFQKTLRPVHFIPHSRSSMRLVSLVNAFHNPELVDRLKTNLLDEDKRQPKPVAKFSSIAQDHLESSSNRSLQLSPEQNPARLSSQTLPTSPEPGFDDDDLDDFIVADNASVSVTSSQDIKTQLSRLERGKHMSHDLSQLENMSELSTGEDLDLSQASLPPLPAMSLVHDKSSSDSDSDLPDVGALQRSIRASQAAARSHNPAVLKRRVLDESDESETS